MQVCMGKVLLIVTTYTTHAAVAHCIGSEGDQLQCDDMIMTVCESLISNDSVCSLCTSLSPCQQYGQCKVTTILSSW